MPDPRMRDLIRDALGVMMIVGGEIATGLTAVDPAPGSRMAMLLGGKKLAEASSAAMIFHHRVAAADHVRAFSVLTKDGGFSTSVAAVVRSGIESLARAWWLIRSESAEELRHKAALAIASELRAAGKRGVRMRDPELTVEQALADAETDLAVASSGRPKLALPGYSALAIEILEAAGTSEAQATYSHLSGIAHGEVTFTTGLGANRGALPGEADWLELADHNFQHYALTLFAANMHFMNALVDSFALADFTERWHASLRQSVEILQGIKE